MNACEECREQLPGLVLQALEGTEAERVQAHLSGCTGCQESLAELKSTFQAADAWQVPEPAPALKQRIQLAIAQEPDKLTLWQAFKVGLERLACYRPSPVARLAGLILGICLFGIVLYPNTQRSHSEGGLAGCRTNQDILRTALTDYARDHDGHFPNTLRALDPVYVRAMPTCPQSGTDTYSPTYEVAPDAQRYTLSCSTGHH
jgi:hypothetical protein